MKTWYWRTKETFSKRAITTIAIILTPLIYFCSAVKGSLALVQGDGWTANLGLRILVGELLKNVEIPLWNPYIFSGMPLLASIYPGSLYPPNWIFALLSPGVAVNLVVITTYHWAIIGSYRYARSLGFSRSEAFVTGITFAFGGFMVMSMGQTATIATAAWFPWILLAIEKLYQNASWRWVILGAIFVALQFFGGVPQMTWYTVLVGGAYFLFSVLLRKQNHSRLRFAISIFVMALGGALLSAVQLLPLRELQQQSGRAGIAYDYFSAYSFPPSQILALIFPYLFGGAVQSPYKIQYWGEWGIFVTCGYVSLLGLLFVFIAALGKKNVVMWFWLGVAAVSLVLAFGSYLPFGANFLLYKIPVYNLFRGSFRHMLEFTFSCAVLAGAGMKYLRQSDLIERRELLKKSVAILASGVTCALLVYKIGGARMIDAGKLPQYATSLMNAEVLIPLFFFAASIAAAWFYVKTQFAFFGTLIIVVLMADLIGYGYFLEWKSYTFSVSNRLADPPTVKFIKSRETDLNSFRMMSYAPWPWENYELLNYPNNSIARGLQSANGYDMLRLTRPASVMGEMSPDGVVQEIEAFGVADQGLNLFNVKYLLLERNGALGERRSVVYDGVRFREKYLELKLAPGGRERMILGGVTASEIVIVSTMTNSAHLKDGTPILKVSLNTKSGQTITRDLQIGRDTSEWAYDRADVRSGVKHQRARVIESWPVEDGAGSFEGHRYLARLSFERSEIESIKLDYVGADAEILIMRASLYDPASGLSYPLDSISLLAERWQKLASFGAVDLYQNLKSMPRAWFVNNVMVIPETEVLTTIKSGKQRDGQVFDPSQTALLDSESYGSNKAPLSLLAGAVDAEVSLTRYEPRRIEIKTRNSQIGFLMLSEVYYPGWEARVDGVETRVYRTNYALRGIAIPPGEHKIEFFYSAPSFKRGLAYTGLGILLLMAVTVLGRWKSRQAVSG